MLTLMLVEQRHHALTCLILRVGLRRAHRLDLVEDYERLTTLFVRTFDRVYWERHPD